VCELPARVEGSHGHAGGGAQPGLIEAPVLGAGKRGGVEFDPPAGGSWSASPRRWPSAQDWSLRERRGGARPGVPERNAVGAMARAGTAVAAAPIWTKRRCSGAGRARRCRSMRARSPSRRLDLGRGAPRQRDRPLVLGESIGGLRRGGDACLERGATPGRERAVRERGQRGVLVTVGLVFSTRAHRRARSNADAAPGRRGRLIGAAVVAGRSRLSRAEGLHTVADPASAAAVPATRARPGGAARSPTEGRLAARAAMAGGDACGLFQARTRSSAVGIDAGRRCL
jgi:hypothetical protein